MASPTNEDLDRDALFDQLKSGPEKTSAPFGGERAAESDAPRASTMPVAPVNGAPITPTMGAPVAPPAAAGGAPWQKGQILGGARQGADFARLGGGFGDANTDSIKHTFGRIAQNFEHTPQGLNALMQDEEFKRLFPSATVNKDWIDFGGQLDPHTGTKVNKIDVMHAFDPTMQAGNNKNWQWLTEEDALAGGGGGGAAAQQNNAATNPALLAAIGGGATGGGGSAQDQLSEEIKALIAGGATPSEVEALQAQLR